MENASKALLMAAGMFLTVLIMSLLVVLYNQISSYYNQQHELTAIEQAREFNAKFEAYNRDNIIGTDLLSFMNMVIDYNATESYQEGTNYERIKVEITLGDDDILEQFKPPDVDENNDTEINQFLMSTITNTTGTGSNLENDKNLIAITNTPSELIRYADSYDINLTEAKLQKLSSEIPNIIVSEDDSSSYGEYTRLKRASLIKKILGIEIEVDNETGKSKTPESEDIVECVENVTSQYYQYTQFKKAYFDCTEMNYNPDTNRVNEVKFELQVKDDKVVFK